MHGYIGAAQVGVALNVMLVANGTLLKLVENWTGLEISMGAVARLRDLEGRVPGEYSPSSLDLDEAVPENWPSEGRLEFKDVSASYGFVSPSPLTFYCTTEN